MFLGFAGEAYDNIGGNRAIWNLCTDLCHEVAELFFLLSAFHVFENGIVTGLDGQLVTAYERVDPQALTVDMPDEGNMPECAPREVPEWPLE